MILSVSRRTDVPCCFPAWIMGRVRDGYALVRNPMNPVQVSRVPISPETVDCIVFWTKDPAPLLPYLDELDGRGYSYCFQFTLTPYGGEIEPGLRDKGAILDTFLALSRRLGKARMLWRYDPILLGQGISPAWHEAEFLRLCRALSGAAEQVTVSFVDAYPARPPAAWRAPSAEEQAALAAYIGSTAAAYGIPPAACCEQGDFTPFGVRRASCIDRDVLERVCGAPLSLGPAKGQRPGCGCCESVDIGAYNTCRNGCIYCYANRTSLRAPHDPDSPFLAGGPLPADTIRARPCRSNKKLQTSLFE